MKTENLQTDVLFSFDIVGAIKTAIPDYFVENKVFCICVNGLTVLDAGFRLD